jgi:3-oxoacyl-[acyl-carrier-protein] synthase I
MTPLFLTSFTATSCLGTGLGAMSAALHDTHSGLAPCRFEDVALDTWIGAVAEIDNAALPASWERFECRNNRLAFLGLGQDGFMAAVADCVSRVGAHRVGLFLGTSTSGILQTELAYRHRDSESGALPASFYYAGSHNVFSAAAFTRELLGIRGPTAVVSTACSSSAKAFGSAQRMIELGIIDAAVVGGVDSLCLTTLYGFHSLQLTSRGQCRPFAADRICAARKSSGTLPGERRRSSWGRRIQRRLSSFVTASARPRRAPRDGIRAQCGRPQSGCDRLYQSARHGHDEQ